MNVETQIECLKIVKKYHKTESVRWKNHFRNKLFSMLHNYMLIWMKSIMGKWGLRREETELISLSWDAFMFALDYFDKERNTPIPIFFYKYTRYFLLTHYAKQQSVTVSLEDLAETLELVSNDENMMFGKLLRLYQFRECLPNEHKVVWDDAYMSLSSADQYKKTTKKVEGISQASYFNLKRSFISIITFVLKN